jgi:hypothetical protein
MYATRLVCSTLYSGTVRHHPCHSIAAKIAAVTKSSNALKRDWVRREWGFSCILRTVVGVSTVYSARVKVQVQCLLFLSVPQRDTNGMQVSMPDVPGLTCHMS